MNRLINSPSCSGGGHVDRCLPHVQKQRHSAGFCSGGGEQLASSSSVHDDVTALNSGHGAKMRQGCVDPDWRAAATINQQHYVSGPGFGSSGDNGSILMHHVVLRPCKY